MKTRLALVLFGVVFAAVAWADFEWLVPIIQPVVSDGSGRPVPCVTTYSAYFSPEEEAVARIELTVAPNGIMMNASKLSDRKPSDRNAAAKEGILLAASQRADTLFAHVDVSAVVLPPLGGLDEGVRSTNEEIVAMTLWCGLRNVRGVWPKVRYVKYNLVGNVELRRYSGTYRLESMDPPTARARLDMKTFGPLSP